MSNITRIHTNDRMSKIVIHNNTVYLCGQVAEDRSKDITEQTQTMLDKVESLLLEAGSDKKHILSATIYLKTMEHFTAMNTVWDNWTANGVAPARACVQAEMATPELLVEISITAAVITNK